MSGTAAQLALVGESTETPSRPQVAPAVNDLAAIEAVLRAAVHTGYVLGPQDRVARRVPAAGPDAVELVEPGEALAVRQLIGSRHLSIGGSRTRLLGGRSVTARSVLVPASTRALVARWSALRPLAG